MLLSALPLLTTTVHCATSGELEDDLAPPSGASRETQRDAAPPVSSSPSRDASARDAAAHDASRADASPTDGSTPSDAAVIGCTTTTLGEFAVWQGKVNVHRAPGGDWSVDDDCMSGAEEDDLAYCQKFWPSATSILSIDISPEGKGFTSGGGIAPECGGGREETFPGYGRFTCCE